MFRSIRRTTNLRRWRDEAPVREICKPYDARRLERDRRQPVRLVVSKRVHCANIDKFNVPFFNGADDHGQ